MIRASLSVMEQKCKQIKRIQTICNTILANCCYSEKEMTDQLLMAEKRGKLTEEERAIVLLAWNKRNEIGNSLMVDLKNYLGESGALYEKTTKKERRI